jgi:zona occludens toxin
MGAKAPREIQALETHRHLGIDFVIITQNPMLIDQNVRRLIGRHQHVRRLFGMQRAVIYDWDGCSVDPTRTKSATMSFFNYPKSAYALYKSSELHTKQKQKIPAWMVIPVMAIIGGAFLAPTAFATLSGAMTGKGISQQPAPTPKVAAPSITPLAPLAPSSTPSFLQTGGYVPPAPNIASSLGSASASDATEYAGCIVVRDRCGCFTPAGKKVIVDQSVCVPSAGRSDAPKALVVVDPVPPTPAAVAADGDAFAYMRRSARVH